MLSALYACFWSFEGCILCFVFGLTGKCLKQVWLIIYVQYHSAIYWKTGKEYCILLNIGQICCYWNCHLWQLLFLCPHACHISKVLTLVTSVKMEFRATGLKFSFVAVCFPWSSRSISLFSFDYPLFQNYIPGLGISSDGFDFYH